MIIRHQQYVVILDGTGACQQMEDKAEELGRAFSDKKKVLVSDPNFKKVNNNNIKDKLKEQLKKV